MTFTNYQRYKEAVNHINQAWADGCLCGVCRAVDKHEDLKFRSDFVDKKKKLDKNSKMV